MKIFTLLLGIVIGAGGILLFNKLFNEDKKNVSNAKPRNLNINYADPGFGNLIDSTEAALYLDTYKKKYRDRNNDTLTRAVWFSKNVVQYIDSSISDANAANIDGIRIYIGAYNKKIPTNNHQKFTNQISLFIVPTRAAGNGRHADDWNYFKVPKALAVNHGELCPNNCNESTTVTNY